MQIENVAVNRRKGSLVELNLEISAAEVASQYRRALQVVAGAVQIPGFRKGKAPLPIVEREYAARARQIAEDEILRGLGPIILEKSEVDPADIVAPPRARPKGDLQPDAAFAVDAFVSVAPKIEPRGYSELGIRMPQVVVPEERVTEELERTALRNAPFAVVERAAKEGDLVVVDGESVGLEQPLRMEQLPVVIGAASLPKEFQNSLVGMKADSEKEIGLPIPKDFGREDLREKAVTMKVRVAAVKERRPQPIDDDFAKDMNFENLDALKVAVRAHLESIANQEADRAFEADLLEKLRELHPVEDLPQTLVEQEVKLRMNRLGRRLGELGMKTEEDFEEFLKRSGETRESFRENMEKDARTVVHSKLIARAIARKEGLSVSDDEYISFVHMIAQSQNKSTEGLLRKIAEDGLVESVKNECLEQKVLHFLRKQADTTGERKS